MGPVAGDAGVAVVCDAGHASAVRHGDRAGFPLGVVGGAFALRDRFSVLVGRRVDGSALAACERGDAKHDGGQCENAFG